MKLAEALSIRADLQNRIDQLKSRLKHSAKVQEGDQPSENVNELYKNWMNAFRNSKWLFIGLTAPTCKPCTREKLSPK